MPDTNELKKWLKVKDLQVGDKLQIVDEGAIRDFEFVDKESKKKQQGRVLEIGVTLDGVTRKPLTLNAISITNLTEAWGSNTKKWVGKSCEVKSTKMMSFGKLTDMNYLEPAEKTEWEKEDEPKAEEAPVEEAWDEDK